MPAYPSLPISYGGPYVRTPRDYQTIRTSFELGYVQTRAKTTVGLRTFRFAHKGLTSTEKATWESFWESVQGGSATFDFTEPISGTVYACRFQTDGGKPELTPVGYDTWDITGIVLEEAL